MKGIIAWFAQNSVAANLLMLLLIVGGVAAVPAIQQKSFPDIEIEVIQIGVPYLGAAPEEVEEGVCVRIEEEIQGIDGIERITSSASEGACGVSAELISGYPIDRALAEIKNAVDGITTFPSETEKPTVSHLALRRNAIQLALSGDVGEKALKSYGERIRDEISALPDVTQVELTSARVYELSIEVPEESLRRYGITFSEVVEAVRRGSLDRPGGSLKTASGEILLRTKGQAYTGADFEGIVVLSRDDGTRVLLSDVAAVNDGFEEEDRYSRFNGEPAVIVKVYRVGDQKVLDLVARVKEYVAGAEARLPEGLTLTVWQDGAQVLRDRLDILIRNGRGGFILVFIMLALFLRLRLAFWVSIGVPISFLGALAVFPVLDQSIDVISLFAFILVLGLLVDDAIVVGENVHRHQERAEDPLNSAIRGTQEVSVPVIFGVLTTVAAFIPMITAPGTMGQIFGAIGIVVICCLLFSVVESQLILPAHLGHSRVKEAKELREGSIQARWKRVQHYFSTSLERLAQQGYRPALERALEWRYSTLSLGVTLLLVVFAVVASGRMSFSFFPEVEGDYVTARLAMPQGTRVQETADAVRAIEESALALQAELAAEFGRDDEGRGIVRQILASVGAQPSLSRRGPSDAVASKSHVGEVTIELTSSGRPISAKHVEARWRDSTPPVAGVDELTFNSALFSAGDPIDVELQSPDVEQLKQAADALKRELSGYAGVFDLADSFTDGKEEMRLSILPAAQTLGVTLDDLAQQVRQAFYGAEAQRIQRARDDIRVMVRYPREERRSLDDLANLRIRTPDGGEVPFYAVAKVEPGRGYATIKRSDRQRVIDVTADVDATQGNANQILRSLRTKFLPSLMGDYPGMSYRLGGEQREQAKAMGGLIRNYGFALILIYVLLAIPLRSYAQPLIIMAVIPFGLVGAITGHLLLGLNLSMMSVFGVVALSGVVVNASLVLVHYVNQRRDEGEPVAVAIRNAGVARFRPIVLTSITTFAGLTPLLLETSVTAQFLIPMATSLAFGVIFASAISLFLVPSSYMILEDLLTRLAGRRPQPVVVTDAEGEPGGDASDRFARPAIRAVKGPQR